MTPEDETRLYTEALQHVYGGDCQLEGGALRDWLDDRGMRLVGGAMSAELVRAWTAYIVAITECIPDLELVGRALLFTAGDEAGGTGTESFTDDERAHMVELGHRYLAMPEEATST